MGTWAIEVTKISLFISRSRDKTASMTKKLEHTMFPGSVTFFL